MQFQVGKMNKYSVYILHAIEKTKKKHITYILDITK